MEPLVTVILTVYKRVDYLPEALESALAQTFESVEIIVVDDSGTEAAKAICDPYLGEGKIRYRANKRNLGIVTSIRETAAEARGEILAILNDDDAWEPEFLARVISPLNSDPLCMLSFSDHWIMDEKSVVDTEKTDANTQLYRKDLMAGVVDDPFSLVLLKNGVPLAMASAFRKDAIDWNLFGNEVAGAYDFWTSCLLASTGGKFYYTAERLTRYRVHGSMETGRRAIDKHDNMVFIYSQLLERGWFPSHEAVLEQQLAAANFQAGKDRLYFEQRVEARLYFKNAHALAPSIKTVIAPWLTRLPKCLLRAFKLIRPR